MHPQHRNLLDLMKPLRDSLSRVRAASPECDEAKELQRAIDKFAGKSDGQSRIFLGRPASYPVRKGPA